jgi:hypothetical protein
MAYIVRTNGGPDVLSVQEGTMAGIHPSDQMNWRAVAVAYPDMDGITQIQTVPQLSVSSDGNMVSMTFAVVDLPGPWARMCLAQRARAIVAQRMQQPVALPDGTLIAIDATSMALILGAIGNLSSGAMSGPITFPSASGSVSWQLADFQAAALAIGKSAEAMYAALNTCLNGISNGTITRSAQVAAAL